MYGVPYLHVCAVQQCVQVGQTNGCLVLEPGQQSLLDGSELFSVAANPLSTVEHVCTQLCNEEVLM